MFARLKAFAVHLFFSCMIALLCVALVFFVWYPGPLSLAMGVTHVFLLMLMVDVILGPLLTLVVYKAGKRSLKLDLAVIGLLQMSALIYGINTVAEGRPVWLVFTVDRFEAVRVMDLDTRFPEKVRPEYSSPSLLGPRWVAAERPTDPQLLSDITLESVFAGLDIQHRPYLYRPLSESAGKIRNRILPLNQLNEFNSVEQVEAVLDQWPEADAWLPLMANVKPMVVLINRESAEVVSIVDLDPWG